MDSMDVFVGLTQTVTSRHSDIYMIPSRSDRTIETTVVDVILTMMAC